MVTNTNNHGFTNCQEVGGSVRSETPGGPTVVRARLVSSASASHSSQFFAHYDLLLQEIESLSDAPGEMDRAQAGHSSASSKVVDEAAKLNMAKISMEHYDYKLAKNRGSLIYRTPFQPSTWLRGGRKGRISRCEAKRHLCTSEVSRCTEAFKSAQQVCAAQEDIVNQWAGKVARKSSAEAEVASMRSDVVAKNRSAELSRLEGTCAAARVQRDEGKVTLESLTQMERLAQQAHAKLFEAYNKQLVAQGQHAEAERLALRGGSSSSLEQAAKMSRDRGVKEALQLAQEATSLLQEAFSVIPAAVCQVQPGLAARAGGPGALGGPAGQGCWQAGGMFDIGAGFGAMLTGLSVGNDIQQNIKNIMNCERVLDQQLGKVKALVGIYERDVAVLEQSLAEYVHQLDIEASRIFDEVRFNASHRRSVV
mmetsp:Transcript_158/g.472  ORF Transcript_158/g.472 Transcript_158/m.472 type:complete len:423 (+) Transcript_158:52-1320(+)